MEQRKAIPTDYEEYHEKVDSHFGSQFVPKVCDRYKFRSVLDVGGGKGYALDFFKARCKNCTLVDISKTALEKCRHPHKLIEPYGELPFEDNSFDLIFCTDVLEHLEEKYAKRLIKEMERVAKKYIFATICFRESYCAKSIQWHLTIRPRKWWEEQFSLTKLEGWRTESEPNFFVYGKNGNT